MFGVLGTEFTNVGPECRKHQCATGRDVFGHHLLSTLFDLGGDSTQPRLSQTNQGAYSGRILPVTIREGGRRRWERVDGTIIFCPLSFWSIPRY